MKTSIRNLRPTYYNPNPNSCMCIPFRGHREVQCDAMAGSQSTYNLYWITSIPFRPSISSTYEFFVAAGPKPKLRFGYVTVVVVYPRQGASTPTSWQEPKAALTERPEGKSDPKEKDIPNRGIVGNKTTILFNRKSYYR